VGDEHEQEHGREVIPKSLDAHEGGALNQGAADGNEIGEIRESENSVVGGQKDESSSVVPIIKDVENQQNTEEEEGQERMKLKGKEKVGADEGVMGEKPYVSLVRHKCKGIGHMATDCRANWPGERGGRQYKNLSDLVAPLCAIQVEGQSFFCILDCPSQANAKERVNTAIVKVLKGVVTTKMIEDEFTRILPGL
jgi:hypothetical protein